MGAKKCARVISFSNDLPCVWSLDAMRKNVVYLYVNSTLALLWCDGHRIKSSCAKHTQLDGRCFTHWAVSVIIRIRNNNTVV